MAKRPAKGPDSDRAQSLLRRFPIVDLARAVSATGSARRLLLTNFVDGYTTLSYRPTRDAARMIYGAQKPLFETPPEPWIAIEKHLRATTRARILTMNLEASKLIFDLVRPEGYAATECEEEVIRVRLKQVVYIGLNFYVTKGDRLIFQFPLPRLDSLGDRALLVLGSVIHHAYARGDYRGADIEIADIGRPARPMKRTPRIRQVPRDGILALPELTEQIDEVYDILRELAARPPPPP